MLSTILGNSSESECVDAPFFTLHFFVNVIAGSPSCSSESPIHALINHGCDTVLMRPDLADSIGLICCKLLELKIVIMAVGGNKKEEFVFEEYGKMSIMSSDQQWLS